MATGGCFARVDVFVLGVSHNLTCSEAACQCDVMCFDMFLVGFCNDLKRCDMFVLCFCKDLKCSETASRYDLTCFEVFLVGFCNDLKCFDVFGCVFEVS